VPQGEAVIRAHLEHLIGHGEADLYRLAIEYLTGNGISVPRHDVAPPAPVAACPGSAARSLGGTGAGGQPSERAESELRQWPIQLKLLNPGASYFDDADLLVSGDCVPFAYTDFHRDFLRDRILIMFCPKLDADVDGYVTKLAEIFSQHTIRSVTVLHMEVPCCSGVRYVVDQALKRSGKEMPVEDHTITLHGRSAEDGDGPTRHRAPQGCQDCR
jgi:hypothetical protein